MRGLFKYSDSLNNMKQMVIISSLLHLTIIGLVILIPTLTSSRKKIVLSPIYTVDIVEMASTEPKKKIMTQKTQSIKKKSPKVEKVKKKTKVKSKPKKTKNITRSVKKKKPTVKKTPKRRKRIVESKVLADLKVLEDKLNSEKVERKDKKMVKKSNTTAELDALIKKWAEEEKRKEKVPEELEQLIDTKIEEPIAEEYSSLKFVDMNKFPCLYDYYYIIEEILDANWREPLLSTQLDRKDIVGKKVKEIGRASCRERV